MGRNRFGATILIVALLASVTLGGCRPKAPAFTPGLLPFADGQSIKYGITVSLDGRSGTGLCAFLAARNASGALELRYEGKGPGIPGAPIYDGATFANFFVLPGGSWVKAFRDSLDGRAVPMMGHLLADWDALFSAQTSWGVGTAWTSPDGTVVTLTGKSTYAGLPGMTGRLGDGFLTFCANPGVALPLYVKTSEGGVTWEYVAVEASGF
jgi:hypothetical protein